MSFLGLSRTIEDAGYLRRLFAAQLSLNIGHIDRRSWAEERLTARHRQ